MASSTTSITPPPQEITPSSSPLASPADVVWPPHILSYTELDLKAAAISHYSDSIILPQLDAPGSKLDYSGLSSTLLGTYFPSHADLDLSRRFDPLGTPDSAGFAKPLLLHKYGAAPDLDGLLAPHVMEGLPGGSYILDGSHYLPHQDLFHSLDSSRILVPSTPAREDQDLVDRLSTYPVLPPVPTTSSGQYLDTPATVLLPSTESSVLLPSTDSSVLLPAPESTVLLPAPESSVLLPSTETLLPAPDNSVLLPAPESSVLLPNPESAVLLSAEETSSKDPVADTYSHQTLGGPEFPDTDPSTPAQSTEPLTSVVYDTHVATKSSGEDYLSKESLGYQDLSKHYTRSHCEDCDQTHRGECPNQTLRLIPDKPVRTRAWASLPGAYLYVAKVPNKDVLGVYAKKPIPKRTQFGPVEGVLVPCENASPNQKFLLKVKNSEGQECYLDTTDEMRSNWMPFVRPAEQCSQQNLAAVQQGTSIFFHTICAISARSELRVWYSEAYASFYNLPLLSSLEEQQSSASESWPCFECNAKFSTSSELQLHLNNHDKNRTRHRSRPFKVKRSKEAEKLAATRCKRRREKAALKSKAAKQKEKESVKEPEVVESQKNSSKKSSPSPSTKKSAPSSSTKKTLHTCSTCHKSFPRMYSLQRHMMLHSNERKYLCPICHLSFSQVYNRNRHILTHKQKDAKAAVQLKSEAMECLSCQLEFPSAQLLTLHQRCHTGTPQEPSVEELCRCPLCDMEFQTGQALGDHVKIHASPWTSKCSVCNKQFTTDERLLQHLALHSGDREKLFNCTICCEKFTTSQNLSLHLRAHIWVDTKIYKCPFCEDKFEYSFALRNHTKIHLVDGKFDCPVCSKTFTEYNAARKHIRTYHGNTKFFCEECGKEFSRPDKLRVHMLRHSDHKEFLCSVCGKQFKRKDKLKNHLQRVHDPKKEAALAALMAQRAKNKFIPEVSPREYHRFIYKCHLCLLGFKRRGMLVNHLAKRHPEVPPDSVPELNLPILKTTRDYYCQYCSKVYKSSSKRKAHILKNHPGSSLLAQDGPDSDMVLSQTVGSITTHPHHCPCCHKQYASKSKLIQHERRKHPELWGNPSQEQTVILPSAEVQPEEPRPPESPPKDDIVVEPNTQEEEATPAPCLTQMSAALAELLLAQRVGGGSAIVIDTTRQRIYVEGAAATSVAAVPAANNDVLTQAMSELTQALVEYRSPTGQYLITRVMPQESQPTTTMMVDWEEGPSLDQILSTPWLGELAEDPADARPPKLEVIPQ